MVGINPHDWRTQIRALPNATTSALAQNSCTMPVIARGHCPPSAPMAQIEVVI